MNLRNNGSGVRIYPSSLKQHNEIVNILVTSSYDFHTYSTKDQRRKCFMIRGITSEFGFECKNIYDELVRAGFPENTAVTSHSTSRLKANCRHALYKVIVADTFDEHIFKAVRSKLGIAVRFERYISKSTTQCSRCQYFFHTAAGCHRPFRCVKCISNHEPGCCSKPIDSEPQCVNCLGFHSADNHHNCDYYKKNIQPILDRRKDVSTMKNHSNSNRIIQNSKTKANASNNVTGESDVVSGRSWSSWSMGHASIAHQRQAEGAQSIDVLCELLVKVVEGQNKIISKPFNNDN